MWQSFFLNLLISTLLQELARPKTHYDRPKPAGLDEITYPTSSEDRSAPLLWGTKKFQAPNLTWYGDLRTQEINKTIRTGLISKEKVPLGNRYHLGMQLGLCAEALDQVFEVWAGETLAWKGTATGTTSITLNARWKEGDLDSGLRGTLRIYAGSTTQDPYLGGLVSVNPHMRHTSYAVFLGPSSSSPADLNAGRYAGFVGVSPNLRPLHIVAKRLPKVQPFGISAADAAAFGAIGTLDANPAFCVLEAICNPDWGAGIPPALLNIQSFRDAAARLKSEGNGCSLLWDTPRPVLDVINELIKQANGVLSFNMKTGLIDLRLIREDDQPVFALTDDNIIRVESYSQATADEATNEVRLSFTDISAGFVERVAVAQDLGGIEATGQVIPATVQYPGVSNPALAMQLVNRDLQAVASPLAKISLRAFLPAGVYAHPGELLTVSFTRLGLVSMPVRVLRARYAESGRAEVQLELVQDTFKAPSFGLYAASLPPLTPEASSAPPAVINAGTVSACRLFTAPYAFTGDEADHALFVAFAPDANTTAYNLAFANASAATYTEFNTEYLQRTGLAFGALGTLAGAIPDHTAGSVVISLASPQAGNAAALRRALGQTCPAFIGNEVAQVVVAAVNEAGTQATLTLNKRGLYDTAPLAKASGAEVVVLLDYGVDPAPLRTRIYSEGGQLFKELPGQTDLYIVAQARNANGYAPFGTAAKWQGDPVFGSTSNPPGYGVRAALPCSPGNIRLGGLLGGSTKDTATPLATGTPNLSTGENLAIALTWNVRNRASQGLNEWDNAADTQAEAGVFSDVRFERWNGSAWVASGSQGYTSDGTIRSQNVPNQSSKPAHVRARVAAYDPAAGISSGEIGTPWWYWRLD